MTVPKVPLASNIMFVLAIMISCHTELMLLNYDQNTRFEVYFIGTQVVSQPAVTKVNKEDLLNQILDQLARN